jgi:hypothetical protein
MSHLSATAWMSSTHRAAAARPPKSSQTLRPGSLSQRAHAITRRERPRTGKFIFAPLPLLPPHRIGRAPGGGKRPERARVFACRWVTPITQPQTSTQRAQSGSVSRPVPMPVGNAKLLTHRLRLIASNALLPTRERSVGEGSPTSACRSGSLTSVAEKRRRSALRKAVVAHSADVS